MIRSYRFTTYSKISLSMIGASRLNA